MADTLQEKKKALPALVSDSDVTECLYGELTANGQQNYSLPPN